MIGIGKEGRKEKKKDGMEKKMKVDFLRMFV
jgi:hypothetical protein